MVTKTDTEQERALLPCPFCGSVDTEVQTSTPDREGTPTHLMCADCGAAGPWSYERGGSYTVAAALWNSRAALQSQDREDEVEFQIGIEGEVQAQTFGPREQAWAEIQRYAAQYAEDGPIEIWEVTRRRIEGGNHE